MHGAHARYQDEHSDLHPGVTLTCTISPSGDSFAVNVEVHTSNFYFKAQGTLASSGGALDVSEQSGSRSTRDRACKISIPSNQGTVKRGAIWARFDCEVLGSPDASDGAPCTESGAFLFENCGKS
jgi:hypothetical protein